MTINSNAKINIGLEILNKRDDGYHNINTFFYKIPLFDEIILENSQKFNFTFNSSLNLPLEENIAYKAASMIKLLVEIDELPVSITINKNIPAGGGLAGGSSNAGYLLKGLNNFLNLRIDENHLFDVAAKLGSDVPFFLLDSNGALAKGRGELLNSINLKLPYIILLVFPDVHISTVEAYQSLNRDNTPRIGTDYNQAISTLINKTEQIREIFRNEFEEPVFHKHAELRQIKEKLYEAGALFASLSGSGSTVFGFFNDENSARAAEEEFNSYKTHICLPD